MSRFGDGAFAPDDQAQSDDTPTPPSGLPLGGTHSTESPTGPINVAGASAQPERGPEAPSHEAPEPEVGGLAELVQAEDIGQAGPAVLGGEAPDPGDSYGEAGDWPTLQRRERRSKPQSGGALGWLRRNRGGGE